MIYTRSRSVFRFERSTARLSRFQLAAKNRLRRWRNPANVAGGGRGSWDSNFPRMTPAAVAWTKTPHGLLDHTISHEASLRTPNGHSALRSRIRLSAANSHDVESPWLQEKV